LHRELVAEGYSHQYNNHVFYPRPRLSIAYK
jgi:hypothetical protein